MEKEEVKVIDLYCVRSQDHGLVEIYHTEQNAKDHVEWIRDQGIDCYIEHWFTGDHLISDFINDDI